ncbi:MAG TPA: AAA family ATPase, partial [Candidatus Dormibacteraeota bacterium]|nr:AAA family ATPase [Candidatus Dormibacteraeota bacterium]
MTLEGFKTFARRTEIDFQAGLTAIVGPNGSGKTNIIDAFKWVLGETNARDLRGSRMEDVIYSGGLRRSRAPKAQVTLLLDNSEGGLPVDYSEVAITRRVSRSGQSDFFLNGTRVRRRDVLELLQSTGLTIDSYALVNQSNIESIVTSTPAERRGLIEEAAAIRGVKTRRLEAAGQLQALAANVDRLSDLRGEIEPRLELVRIQAEAARKAAVATERLDLLRGSIAWEEWREAKESHRRAESQIGSLRRRLVEAQAAAVIAEDRFQVARRELTAAQGRQVAHQERLGTLRVKLSQAEHGLALARERISGQEALAAAAEQEDTQRELRLEAVATEASALRGDLDRGRAALAAVPQPPNPPPLPTAEESRAAHRKADAARQAHTAASNQLVSIRARRELLEQNAKALAADLDQALSQLGDAEAAAAQATAEALAIREKASRLRSARAELEGLRALVVTPAEGLRRLGEVVVANPGYEAAVSAVLGPFIDAWVAPDESAANQFVDPTSPQRTIFYPAGESSLLAQCLLEHVRVEPGYESIAQSFLGDVVVAVEGKVSVSLSGIYRRPGMVRAGDDPRARLDARRRLLADEVAALELKSVPEADSVNAARQAEAVVAGLRSRVGARQRLEQMTGELDLVRKHESTLAGGLEELESAAARAEESSRSLSQALDLSLAQAAEHRAEVQRLDQERSRWRERCADLERRLQGLDQEHRVGIEARAQRTRRREAATARAQEAAASLVGLEDDLTAARAALKVAEQDLPDQAAELAGMAKGLVAIEEARVDARLRVGGLDSELALRLKDAELAMARLDEVKARMPEGRAPEEVPGGKAREREIRLLERELVDIGPT